MSDPLTQSIAAVDLPAVGDNMKTKPILFNGDMIRALLDGRKTQTRRIIKPQPVASCRSGCVNWSHKGRSIAGAPAHVLIESVPCPYGQPGDLLFVRETWRASDLWDDTKPKNIRHYAPIQYEATEPKKNGRSLAGKVRPSIFMPRWASRLTLLIKDVRVERAQDISEADALAEGIRISESLGGCPSYWYRNDGEPFSTAREAFRALWDSINADRGFGWDDNPWVWVIEFEVIQKNVDSILTGEES